MPYSVENVMFGIPNDRAIRCNVAKGTSQQFMRLLCEVNGCHQDRFHGTDNIGKVDCLDGLDCAKVLKVICETLYRTGIVIFTVSTSVINES